MSEQFPWRDNALPTHVVDTAKRVAMLSERPLRLEMSHDEGRALPPPRPARPPRPPNAAATLPGPDVLAAVRALDTGAGAAVAELEKLGVVGGDVRKADALVEARQLVERNKRPRQVAAPE